ncbi:MAG: hypothetical protein QM784_01185 [Polyangiaceae bacterium]
MRKNGLGSLFAMLFATNVAFYAGCSDGNPSASGGTGGDDESQTVAGHAGAGGLTNANAGGRSGGNAGTQAQGGATQSVGGATQAQGGATQSVGGATQAQGGATQSVGGATQAQGGATQSVGGATQAQGGATQSVGGTGQGGSSNGVGGASGTSTEPCVGEESGGVCIALAPLTLVQSAKRTAGTAAPTDVVKLSADSKSGSLLVLGVGVIWNAAAQTITVPSGFTLVERRDNTSGTAQETAALYIAEGAQSLAASTGVTVTVADSSARQYLVLAEYAGLLATNALDQKASQAGSSMLSTGTTAMTTMSNELWLAIVASRGGNAHQNPTNGFAFVQQMTTGAGAFSLIARQATERGLATSGVTGSGDYASVVATFRRAPL